MGRLAEVNQATLLVLKTYDGNTTRGVQARVYNDAGTEQSGSPFTLSHAARGNYKSTSWTPNTPGMYYVNYEVFTDGTFGTLDTNYTQLTEVVFVRSTIQALRDGTAQTGSSSTITLDAGASAVNDYYKGAVVQIVSGTGAGQARSILSYVGSTKVATVESAWATSPDNTSIFSIKLSGTDKTGYSLTSLESSSVHSGTAQAGGSTTITLAASASATDDLYRGESIKIYAGTGAGQVRTIVSYVGSTKVVTVGRAWTVNPDNTSLYSVLSTSGPKINDNMEVTVGTNNDKTGYTLTQSFPANFASMVIDSNGRVDVSRWLGATVNALISGRVDANAQIVGDKTGYSLTQTFPTNFSSLVIDGSGRVDISKWSGASVNALISGKVDSVNSSGEFGTAQTGAAGSITLRAGASATDNIYRYQVIMITGGTGVGQVRVVSAYVGSTKVASVDEDWVTTPDNTSTYALIALHNPKVDSNGRVDLGLWLGSAPNALISGRVDANSQVVADKTGYSLTGAQENAIAAKILATPANLLATDATGRVTVGTNADKSNYLLASSEHTLIGADVWDSLRSSHQVAGSFGISQVLSRDGTAQTGAAGSITLDGGASSVTDYYKNNVIAIVAGVGAGQSRLITAYNGTTKVATISPNWGTNPDNTSVFAILPFGSLAYQILTNPTQTLLTDSSGHVTLSDASITAAKFSANAIDANALAASAADEIAAKILVTPANKLATAVDGSVPIPDGSLTASKFAANAIDANALAADAVTEIVTAIFGKTIDTKTFEEIQEILLAYTTGKIEKSGSAYAYKKQNNTTTLFTNNSTATDRTRS